VAALLGAIRAAFRAWALNLRRALGSSGECVLVATKVLVACDPAENGGLAGHPGFATDGAKSFALGKPGADRIVTQFRRCWSRGADLDHGE
jgi:hypothetical protein